MEEIKIEGGDEILSIRKERQVGKSPESLGCEALVDRAWPFSSPNLVQSQECETMLRRPPWETQLTLETTFDLKRMVRKVNNHARMFAFLEGW